MAIHRIEDRLTRSEPFVVLVVMGSPKYWRNTEVVLVRCELPAELLSARQPRQLSPRGSWRGSRPPHRLMLSGKIADLVEVTDVNWNRNIGGIAVVEEMLEVDLDGNGTNEFAEARHLEIFHVPDFEHEGAEVFADKGHLVIIQIYCVKVRVGEGVHEVQDVGEVSPDDLFFEGGEAQGRGGALLRGTSVLGGLKIVRGELVAKPAKAVALEVEAKELDGVSVREVEARIGVETGEPGRPTLMLERGEERVEIGDGSVAVIFDGLPKVLSGVVGDAIERDAFGDRVPIGEDTCGNGGSSTPAIDGMFPFLLDGDEGVGVSDRSGFGDLCECVAEFVFGVRDERFEGTLVGHGDDTTLDATAKEFTGELLPLGAVENGVARPATGLRVDVGEQFGERSEFDESVNGESDGTAVLGDEGGRRDESLNGDLLSVESGAKK